MGETEGDFEGGPDLTFALGSGGGVRVLTDSASPRFISLVVVAIVVAAVVGDQCLLADVEPRFECLSESGRGTGSSSACTPMLLFSTTAVCTPRLLYSFSFFLLPFKSVLAVTTEPRLERLFADSPSLSSSHLVAEGATGPSSSSSSALSSSSPSRLLISVRSSQLFFPRLRYASSSNAGASTPGGASGSGAEGGLTRRDAYFWILGIWSQAFV